MGDQTGESGHPLHLAALLKDEHVPAVIHEMARSMWALGLEVPPEVHQHVLDNWEAVLAFVTWPGDTNG